MLHKSSLMAGCRKLLDSARAIILPSFRQPDDEFHSRTNLLHIFTIITALVALLIFTAAFLGETNKLASALQAALLFAVSIIVFYINKKGHSKLAVIIFITITWICSTFTILVSGGIHGPYNFLYVVLIAVSVLLVGPGTAWVATVFIIVTSFVIVFLETALNPLPIFFLGPPLAVWIILSTLIILVTAAIQFTRDRASEAFFQSTRELEMRRSAERALVTQNRMMQDINTLGIELAALPADVDLHQFLVTRLKQLSGAAVVSIGEYLPESKAVHVRHVDIDNSLLEKLTDQSDNDIISFASELSSFISPIPDDGNAEIFAQVAGYRDNITEITMGAVPIELSNKIREVFDLDWYAGLAYIFEDTLYGTSILAFKRGQQKPPEELLHAFAALAAVSLRRKRAEDELRERERKYRLLAENVTDVIWTVDMDLTPSFVSPSVYRLRGISVNEAMQQSLEDMLTPQSLEVARRALLDELAVEKIPGNVPERTKILELEVYRKDGSTIWTENTLAFLRDKAGEATGVLGVTRDMSERKKAEQQRISLERQMLQAQKLESLGLLAGGIAHDFNNILSAILGYSELALLSLSKQSPASENILEIEKAAKRAADLSRQMLAYSGRGKFVIEAIDLNELVGGISHLLSVSVSKGVTLRYNLASGLQPVEGDATQIQQVVMNLVTNASEAIGEQNGLINISTGSMQCDGNYLVNCTSPAIPGTDGSIKEGLYVYFEVSDTGCGMERQTMERIFDPFFTTKRTGRGLGLAAAQGIMRSHKGAIRIYSEPEKGTAFKLLFPAASFVTTPHDSETYGAKIRKFGSGSLILLVDDEEAIRAVGQAMLQRLGFEVITVADGDEGIEVFQDKADDIACVILDMTMPKLDGEATFAEMKRINPQATIILSSGYSEHEATQRFTGRGLAGFLQKPYNFSELTAKLKEAIRHKNPSN